MSDKEKMKALANKFREIADLADELYELECTGITKENKELAESKTGLFIIKIFELNKLTNKL